MKQDPHLAKSVVVQVQAVKWHLVLQCQPQKHCAFIRLLEK